MHNMTIGKRFMIATGVCLALLIVLALIANSGLTNSGHSISLMATNTVPTAEVVGDLAADVLQLQSDSWRHMATNNPAGMDRVEEDIRRHQEQAAQDYQRYKLTIDDNDEDHGNYAALGSLLQEYESSWNQVRPVSRTGDTNAAVALYERISEPKFEQIQALSAKIIEYNKRTAQKIAEGSLSASSHALWLSRVITLLALVMGVAVSWFMTSSTNLILSEATLALNEGSQQVVSAAGQVSSSSQTLAQGASEQAATIEETSAAANEINSMAQRNMVNSQNTTEMVKTSQKSFEDANQLLNHLLDAMAGVQTSSNKISAIIKVIEEIAFQTNILALNAAVEAARAGDAGMGFAVVADEVRNLAQRSAQAAKDTAKLIEESIQKSESGNVNVNLVAEAIHRLTEESSRMRSLVDEISTGSVEQAKGTDQISRSIIQMEQVTQSTAASSEECAAAAEELTAQAQSMQEMVQRLNQLVDGRSRYANEFGSFRQRALSTRLTSSTV